VIAPNPTVVLAPSNRFAMKKILKLSLAMFVILFLGIGLLVWCGGSASGRRV